MANPVIEQHADKPAYLAGSLGAILGAMTLQDWLIAVSLASIPATYFTNLYFKIRAERRATALHDRQMERYEERNE